MRFAFAASDADALPLHLVSREDLDDWSAQQTDALRNWIAASGFNAGIGATLLMPGENGKPVCAIAGLGTAKTRKRKRFILAAAAEGLPAGDYRLANPDTFDNLETEVLGWLLQGYCFERYRAQARPLSRIVCPDRVNGAQVLALAQAEALTRDLINTPAADMGPDELEVASRVLAEEFSATIAVTQGDDLLSANLPMIHAVGRAAQSRPRLIDMTWGDSGPLVTLVGKGVCFDTGGLNLKSSSGIGLMKKDMGGAATVLGLARTIMATQQNLRLRVLIPAVENAVSGNAFRPGDVLTSRKGLTVEVNNTDAEGRLVLADALTLAAEENPDLLVCMATLTGAARVALGPDISPYYTDDDSLSDALEDGAALVSDPVWRMPFWDPYEDAIEPGIADLDNAPKGGMGGSITAALFLRRFVGDTRFVHFDIYGWQPIKAPARAKGGVGMGARALFAAIPALVGK